MLLYTLIAIKHYTHMCLVCFVLCAPTARVYIQKSSMHNLQVKLLTAQIQKAICGRNFSMLYFSPFFLKLWRTSTCVCGSNIFSVCTHILWFSALFNLILYYIAHTQKKNTLLKQMQSLNVRRKTFALCAKMR